MLTPKLKQCKQSAEISSLIEEIDCKLAKLAGKMYNNIVLMLNYPIPADAIIDLLHYKRILQYKNVNTDYASVYTVDMIASKVKLLKYR